MLSIRQPQAFLIRESAELQLDNIESRTPVKGAPVVRLDRTPGAIIRSSRAFRGTDTFLSTGADELKNIALEGNVLTSASKPSEETKADFWRAAEPPTEHETVSSAK